MSSEQDPFDGTYDVGNGSALLVYRDLLRDRDFRLFFASTAASSLGDWIGVLAILALTETVVGPGTTTTAFALSGVMVARILPMMLLGPVAGVYADRWDRRHTLVLTDVGRGVVMVALAFSQNFLQLFVASLLVEMLSLLFTPAKEAMLPRLVPQERLVQANQLTLTVAYGTLPLGALAFSGLVASAGLFSGSAFIAQRPVVIAIWVNALTFLLSAPLFYFIDVPRGDRGAGTSRPEGPSQRSLWEELVEGFVFMSERPRIRGLVTGVVAAAFAGGAVFALAKLFVTAVGGGDAGFGIVVAATGFGMLVGLVSALPVATRLGEERAFGLSIMVGGVFATVAAFMPGIASASAAALLMGAGAGLAFVTGYTMLQESTDDDVRGRAFAAFHTGVRLAVFLALVIAPAVVGVLGAEQPGRYRIGGVRTTLALAGLSAVGGAYWSWRQLERT